jgi:hypothetical protein
LCASVGIINSVFDTIDARCKHEDVKILFGIEKFKILSIAKGKLEMRNSTTEDDDTMEAMKEDGIYSYLGHVQSKQIKHAQMKLMLEEEYLNRTKSILKTNFNTKKQ